MKRLSIIMLMTMLSSSLYAQIGYQVSLLNSATGEPRANETVSITVTITNSEDAQIFSSTQSATTNDFGVLSLQVGNSTTFDNVDWRKLPFFISATVDGVMVGKSQILSVPVAEAAKQLVGVPLDSICHSWSGTTSYSTIDLSLNHNMTGYMSSTSDAATISWIISSFEKHGNVIYMSCRCTNSAWFTYSGLAIGYYVNGSLEVKLPGTLGAVTLR